MRGEGEYPTARWGVWMVEGCEQWAHPVGTTMHVGVVAHREKHDRVKVSASPDVPLSEAATSMIAPIAVAEESAPVMMDGATQTDRVRILVGASAALSATMTVARGAQAASEVPVALAEIAARRVKTTMAMAIRAGAVGAMGETCARRGRAGTAEDDRNASGQTSARSAASALHDKVRGWKRSGAGPVVRVHALAHQAEADCGMATLRCGDGGPADRGAAIRVPAAWALGHAIHAIHARCDAGWSPNGQSQRRRRRRRASVAGRRSSSCC